MGMAFKNNTFGTTGAEMGFRSSAIENPDPSANLKFEEVPSGIAAISEVPVRGRLQWVALCGFCKIVVTCRTLVSRAAMAVASWDSLPSA